jgi:hypothetical protein
MDDFGALSLKKTVTVSVQDLPPLHVALDLGESTANETMQVSIVVYVTDGSSPVENANVTMFSVKGGSFAPSSGLTNSTGYFITVFATPDVGDIANVRIVAKASFSGHADGSDYEYLKVTPFLTVYVDLSSHSLKSEGSTPVTVYVSSNGEPVVNAYVVIFTDIGNLSSATGITNSSGVFQVVFAAPVTTQILSASVTANARKAEYVDGMDTTAIVIEPKALTVGVLANPSFVLSQGRLNVTVQVEYEMVPVEGASVDIRAENGTLSITSGLTDINGSLVLMLTVPAVKTSTQIVIAANASATRYTSGEGETTVTVSPKTLNVKFELGSEAIQSEQAANVTVRVICNEDLKPVVGAWITVSSSDGNFSEPNGVTDSSGRCMFTFNSPQTTDQVPVVIAANVTANGYVDGGNQTTITVTPRAIVEAGGGFPMWTLLLIIIPVVIVVVVVVLVKLKIITVSSDEEE